MGILFLPLRVHVPTSPTSLSLRPSDDEDQTRISRDASGRVARSSSRIDRIGLANAHPERLREMLRAAARSSSWCRRSKRVAIIGIDRKFFLSRAKVPFEAHRLASLKWYAL
jgi:hypothetical protein